MNTLHMFSTKIAKVNECSRMFYLQFCPHRLHLQVVPGQQAMGLMLQLMEWGEQMDHLLGKGGGGSLGA